jgi:AcrR family transcriptional regulator
MSTEIGLRERKKLQTRELIAEAAWRLFLERGFDRVTVADVARAADVSEATVFNYFPTKEDLAYHRMQDFESAMLRSIREREPGSSIVQAFGRFVLEPRGFLKEDAGSPATREEIISMFTESPSLVAREREILDRYARALAALIAEERGAASDDLESRVIANALIGLHRALIDHVRSRLLAGFDGRRIAREVRVQGRRALALLENGLDQDPRWATRS